MKDPEEVRKQTEDLQEAAAQLTKALLAITAGPDGLEDQPTMKLVNEILHRRTRFRFKLAW